MHPPLDRSHPDCEHVIAELKACHAAGFSKWLGRCNDIKLALDKCFRDEKDRLLAELNREMPERRMRQEEIVKRAFGREQTFSEYLQQDRGYLEEVAKKKKQQQQQQS
jgi:COX assembly mitochondrial protein 2